MVRYLLDTNIASFLVRRAYPALLHRVRATPASSLVLSVVTEAEVRLGLARMPAEARLHEIVEHFLTGIEIRPWDSRCARHYARMTASQQRLGKPLPMADGMIAAHALADGFTLVTNDKAFLHVEGLDVEDWTKGPQPA